MSTHTEHQHEGTFAEGQASTPLHPEEATHGSFTRTGGGERRHEGSFASGLASPDTHPERTPRGRYSDRSS